MSDDDLAAKLLALARQDLRAAEVLREQPEIGDGIVGFHAQQAAEKGLKAWLTLLGIVFPHTHDLSLLIHKLEESGAEVADLGLLDLNPFAVQFRYDIFDDEPLDHGAVHAQVTALLDHVGDLLADSQSPAVEEEGTPTPPPTPSERD